VNKFTKSMLAKYDGKEGRRALIAYKGLVYDVSESMLWPQGTHWAMHDAGKDMTEELSHAPHDARMLENFPVVGIYSPEDE
jgi:predicted heme/steroid binding protein